MKSLQVRALAISMWCDGINTRYISERTGMAPAAIRNMASKHKVANRNQRITQRLLDAVVLLHSQKHSDLVIAKKLEITPGLAFKMRNKILKLPAINTTSARMKEVYKETKKLHGTLPARRWRSSRFEAWLDGAPDGVTKEAWQILKFIMSVGQATTFDVALQFNKPRDTAIKAVARLRDAGFLKDIGHRNGARLYEATRINQHAVTITKPAVIPEKDSPNQPCTFRRRDAATEEHTQRA